MERRTGDTPMDFEYANGSGLRDEFSPWPKGDPSKKGFASNPSNSTASKGDVSMTDATKGNTFGASSQPSSSFASWSRGVFGSSNNNNAFSTSKTPSTPVQSSVAGYRENPSGAVAFSDTENPSSPDNADCEATPDASPETRPLPDTVTRFRGTQPPRVAAVKSNSSNPFSSLTLPASWRGGASASTKHRSTGGAMMLHRKIAPVKRKRARFEPDSISLYHAEYSGSDADDSPVPGQRSSLTQFKQDNPSRSSSQQQETPPPQSIGLVPAFFTYLHSHPELPRILSSYAQTLLTYFLIVLLCFLVWTCYRVVRSDVDLAVQEAASELVREVGRCAEEFRRNGCGSANGPPPALVTQCTDWNACMNMDPLAVGRARVGARTFSRILNGFFDGMSWKFLSVLGVLLVVIVGNGKALVPPFAGGAARAGAMAPHGAAIAAGYGAGYGGHASFHPSTEFASPYFAPDVPRTPARHRSPAREGNPAKGLGGRQRSPTKQRGLWMDEEPGEGLMLGSPGRSPQRLGYI